MHTNLESDWKIQRIDLHCILLQKQKFSFQVIRRRSRNSSSFVHRGTVQEESMYLKLHCNILDA